MISNFSASASANKKVKAHNTRSIESEKAMVVVLSTAISDKRRVRDVKLDVLVSPGYPLPGSLSDVVRAATPVARLLDHVEQPRDSVARLIAGQA